MTNNKWKEYVRNKSKTNSKKDIAISIENSYKGIRILLMEYELEANIPKKNILKLKILEKLSNILFYTTRLANLFDFDLDELMTLQKILNEQNKVGLK